MTARLSTVNGQLDAALARLERIRGGIAKCYRVGRVADDAGRIARIKLDAMIAVSFAATRSAERLQAVPICRPAAARMSSPIS